MLVHGNHEESKTEHPRERARGPPPKPLPQPGRPARAEVQMQQHLSSPGAPAGPRHREARVPGPRPREQCVHAVRGMGDGLQAERQVYRVPVGPKRCPLLPLRPCCPRRGCLSPPDTPWLPRRVCCLIRFLFMRIRGTTPNEERGDEADASPGHRTYPPTVLHDIWDWGHAAASRSKCLGHPDPPRPRASHRSQRGGQKVFTKVSAGFHPQRLPKLRKAGHTLCKTRSETLLHSVPGRKTHR